MFSAGLVYFWYFAQQPGQIVFRLQPETTRDYVYLGVRYQSSQSTLLDTVRAPGKLYKQSPGKYYIEVIDQDIVQYQTELELKPAESETLVIPVSLNSNTLAVQTEPTGADIWINGLHATKNLC